jgi:hypothetical protein
MSFDGAGKPYRGPSYRGALAMLIVCLVGVALVWLAYSAALDVLADDPAGRSVPVVGVEVQDRDP